MVAKYVRVMEAREINDKTGEIWAINDVPKTWRKRVEDQIIADGYVIGDDGTAEKTGVE